MPSDEFQRYAAKNPVDVSEESRLILCDINGTLILNGGTLNRPLITFLIAARNIGFEVQLFSDAPFDAERDLSSRANLENALGDHDLAVLLDGGFENIGLMNQEAAVMHKSMFSGQEALFVFDDDHSTHNVNAEHELAPDYHAFDQLMKFMGIGDRVDFEIQDARFPTPVNDKPF